MIDWLKNFNFKKETGPFPEYWQKYQEAGESAVAPTTPLSAVDFVVFDTETTGFDKNKDRVISIGAVRVRNGQVLVSESFECLLQQKVASGNKSPEIHGILPSQIQSGMKEEDALAFFLEYIRDAVLVGHHIGFDIVMLKEMLKRCNLPAKLHNKMVDTAQLATRLDHPLGKTDSYKWSDYSLDALSKRYQLPLEDRHTASGDAFATAILLLKLLARARQEGITTLGDLVK